MSDSKIPRITPDPKVPDGPLPARRVPTGLTGRFERPAAARGAGRPPGSRHSAITRNLQSYANYKTWADKMRSNWQPPKDPKV